MAYDTSTFDPKAAAEARKAEMEAMTAKLENGVKGIRTYVQDDEQLHDSEPKLWSPWFWHDKG